MKLSIIKSDKKGKNILKYAFISAIMFVFGCKNDKTDSKPNLNKSIWGKIEEKEVFLFTLSNKNGTKIEISNYGGIVTKWICKDKNQNYNSIVLGFDSLESYVKSSPYFGALIGRYGNRIANGKFTIDNKNYQLATNDGKNSLHGGKKGYDKVVWDYEFDVKNPNSITLSYFSKDIEEGYPGNLKVKVIYSLTDFDELKIEYFAETDQATIINLTQHNYYNLTGDPTKTILNHQLSINAKSFTPVDNSLIPTGEIKNTSNTAFDFSKLTKIGSRIDKVEGGYDHNWVITKPAQTMDLVATLTDSFSGRKMEVFSTEPGLQFYSGNFLDGSIKNEQGLAFQKYTGLCLETQHFPDSPNHKNFPSTVLKPNQVYNSTTIYKVSVQ